MLFDVHIDMLFDVHIDISITNTATDRRRRSRAVQHPTWAMSTAPANVEKEFRHGPIRHSTCRSAPARGEATRLLTARACEAGRGNRSRHSGGGTCLLYTSDA